MPHLVVSISGHGFGHVAQTAPILNVLHEHITNLRLTVRSTVPLSHLRSRIQVPFTYLQSDGDIGMVMTSALDVDVAASRVAYQKFHADWDKRVTAEAQLLRDLKTDFVLSNVGYLPLAGAQRAGICNAALCSLNWADIYQHYCVDTKKSVHAELVEAQASYPSTSSVRTDDEKIATQIHACYINADAFFRATPGMEMANLANLIPIEPLADIGINRRDEIDHRLSLSHDEKLVLVSMGGIASRLPIEKWPRINGVKWLVQQSWEVQHRDVITLETLQMSFGDLLASSDILLCKPGYGSFVEAACSDVPVLFVNRPDWPEAPALVEWLRQCGVCLEISREELAQGEIADALQSVFSEPHPDTVIPQGAIHVAEWLVKRLAS